MPKTKLVRVNPKTGKLVPLSLIEWAARFNEAHSLAKPKAAK